MNDLPYGIQIIAAERRRQITTETWSAEHDNQHTAGELALAAATYAVPTTSKITHFATLRKILLLFWPWAPSWWKPTPHDRIRELAKAGALIAAEIDRLQRCGHTTLSPTLAPDA